MKVLVLGATGKTGWLVVEKTLTAGHEVVALVHSEESEKKHPLPTATKVRHGDAQNPATLRAAMEGCEAVIDTIGGKTPFLETEIESNTAKVVLDVMKELGAQRLIAISAMGVGDSREQGNFFYEKLLIPVFLRGAMKDKAAMEERIEHSDSDVAFVIVRPPLLKDGAPTGSVRVFPEAEEAHQITRDDLAQFLVDQLTSNDYVGQTITVANT